jgi:hypothetical protein
MKYQNLLGIRSIKTRKTSITMVMILITMTIALGPLNLLQINSVGAQNQINPNSSQLTQGPY